MARSPKTIDVYLEIGDKRTFAGAIDWPGWCRIGRDEESALQALVDSGPRYADVLHAAKIAFQAPADLSALVVVERLEGNTTTNFGAPDIARRYGSKDDPVDPTIEIGSDDFADCPEPGNADPQIPLHRHAFRPPPPLFQTSLRGGCKPTKQSRRKRSSHAGTRLLRGVYPRAGQRPDPWARNDI